MPRRPTPPASSPLRIALLAVNALGLVTATRFAAGAVARPEALRSGRVERPLPRLLASASAIRTFAIALPLLGAIALGRRPSSAALVTAGLVQIGDAGLGLWQRNTRMMIAPTIMGVLHLVSARVLAR